MTQVNIYEAKTELSKLVRSLETGEENVIFIARNGKPIVQMTLLPHQDPAKRVGAGRGKFTIPDDFDKWDSEIENMFEGEL